MNDREPLFGCCQCYEDYSWPASDLRVFNGGLWCENCFSESEHHWEEGVYWIELEQFTPEYEQRISELTEALKIARHWIIYNNTPPGWSIDRLLEVIVGKGNSDEN